MKNKMTIHGLPYSLAMDGWWLGDTGQDQEKGPTQRSRFQPGRQVLPILALLVLGDFLFWGYVPGISVALFVLAVFALAQRGRQFANWRWPALLLVMAALPVMDHVQALSLAFLLAGLIVALVWAQRPGISLASLIWLSMRFLGRLPLHWLGLVYPLRFIRWLRNPREASDVTGLPRNILRNWAFPLGGGVVLMSLLLDANPVLERFVSLDLDIRLNSGRPVLWLCLALLVAPFLGAMAETETASPPRRRALRLPGIGINAGSVLRALVLFNLMIGVQSLTDLSILFGGTKLPEEMTLAEYAHRGAYPLLVTAILAGAFALAARSFLHEHRLIRPLLLLWLAQNMLLCGAAALRLDLYINAFGLTHLRLHALIWMGLVAIGLGMAVWQVLRERSNGWLLWRSTILGIGTLYLCSFVNFAQVIAAYNVTHGFTDYYYLCELGPLAAGPIVESGIGRNFDDTIWLKHCQIDVPATENWREWGFRTWAANRYVLRVASSEAHQ
ncbi:MAG: DUF4173 domain-containing protein [Pseudorhodobacter sp.]